MVRPEFLREVERRTKAAGALLIADEVLTGFGRCGDWFAWASMALPACTSTFARAMAADSAAKSASSMRERASSVRCTTFIRLLMVCSRRLMAAPAVARLRFRLLSMASATVTADAACVICDA